MRPGSCQLIALAALLWVAGGACGASDLAAALRHNPFERPPALREARSTHRSTPSVQDPPALELRGTLLSGRPLAIVGEEIIGIGEEVSGYRLTAVQEGRAVLRKGDTRLVLSVDGYQEDRDDE